MTSPKQSLTPRTGRGALLLVVLLSAGGCFLFPIPPGSNPERPYVTSFEIEGTHAISAKELRQHLATQESGRKYLIWPAPEEYDQDAFANDKRRIVRYYQARGYYDARVDSAEVLPDGPGRVKIRLRVDEGQPIRVTQLEVKGLEQAAEARARLKKLPLQVGDVFTEAAYDEARGAILAALTSTGWAKADVSERAEVDPGLHQAHVTYSATPGERFKFGGVFVAGAAAIPRARIRAEAEPVVKPGATFDSSELPQAQARVFDLGVFGGVRVTQGPADAQRRTIPVVVSVREAPFRTIRAGPGFTFQATRWEADAITGWSHRNWLGGLRKLNLDARAGYAWLPNLLTHVQKQGLVALGAADFTQPQMFTRYIDLNLHVELEHGRELAYDFNAERFRVGLPYRLGRVFTFVPSLNIELYQLSNPITQANPGNTAQFQLLTCPGHNPSLCLLSYFEERVGLDFRDDPINTTRGLYVGVSVQEGFSAFGNGSSYLRLLPEVRAFVNLGAGFVLAGRGRLGFLEALPGSNDVPIVARFSSGGPNLMRGYYTRQLSPALLACPDQTKNTSNCGQPLEYVPVGGKGLIDGSFELRYPIAGQLGGATFLDFGTVRFAAHDAFNLGSLQYAIGTGIRYKTVFGPLRLDVAARVPKSDGNQPTVEVLALTNGNQLQIADRHAYPIVSVHLSIGEAF